MTPELQNTLLVVAAVAGYLLLLCSNPAAVHLRDGFRCVQRFPLLWKLPAGFGLAYGIFLIGLDVFFLLLPSGSDNGAQFSWLPLFGDPVPVQRLMTEAGQVCTFLRWPVWTGG